MLTLLYRLIVLFIVICITSALAKEKRPWEQVTAALVLVPLVLRLLMVK